jgi:DNA invertase Pin-like site-specific DNA recombinase
LERCLAARFALSARNRSRLIAIASRRFSVDVRFADLPMIEGATGKFLLQQMAAVAELEAGMISARTKAALAAAKRRGVKLGGDRAALA